MTDRKIRLGLVGCGRILSNHIRAIEEHGDECELVAVCDTIQERADEKAKETGAISFTDLAAMLSDVEMDAVTICTPSGLHPEHGS